MLVLFILESGSYGSGCSFEGFKMPGPYLIVKHTHGTYACMVRRWLRYIGDPPHAVSLEYGESLHFGVPCHCNMMNPKTGPLFLRFKRNQSINFGYGIQNFTTVL